MGEVEGGVLGVGGDCEENVAAGEFAVGEAAAFSATKTMAMFCRA